MNTFCHPEAEEVPDHISMTIVASTLKRDCLHPPLLPWIGKYISEKYLSITTISLSYFLRSYLQSSHLPLLKISNYYSWDLRLRKTHTS